MPDLDKEDLKEAVSKGIENWLDKQYASIGRWTLVTVASVIVLGIAHLVLNGLGWHK